LVTCGGVAIGHRAPSVDLPAFNAIGSGEEDSIHLSTLQ
jgi:hypothetical protein